MDKQTQRNTDVWLTDKLRVGTNLSGIAGPAYYETKLLPSKESFNYGMVPFGSSSYERNIHYGIKEGS